MENLKLKGIYKLENNAVIVSASALKSIVDYVNKQTEVINQMQDYICNLETSLEATDAAVTTNATNIKTIAQALEGVYKNEA